MRRVAAGVALGVALAVAFALPVGAASQTGKAVQKWGIMTEPTLNQLQHDFTVLSSAAHSSDLAALGTGCRTIGNDAEKAQKISPVPDPRAEGNWREALAHYSDGAQSCVLAVTQGDAQLLDQANQEFANGNDALGRASARIKAIGHGAN